MKIEDGTDRMRKPVAASQRMKMALKKYEENAIHMRSDLNTLYKQAHAR